MEEQRPKVLALYQAVLELLDEGMDINTMKVSDITGKAGIGKGTAYDYFKSKEEIIAGAVLYDVEQRVKRESERLNEYEDFSQKIGYSFDWILHHFGEQKAFSRFLRLTGQPCEIRNTLLAEIKKRELTDCGPMAILRRMCREGREKGEIRPDIPVSAAVLMVLGNMAAFVMYLENCHPFPEEETDGERPEPEEMKKLLCRGLLQQLK